MAKIKIIAGSFPKQTCHTSFTGFHVVDHGNIWKGPDYSFNDLIDPMIATEENVKKIGGTVGWGLAGGILLGPVGLLAGLLAGGRKKEVTFVAKLPGDKKILAVTDHKTWQQILAKQF